MSVSFPHNHKGELLRNMSNLARIVLGTALAAIAVYCGLTAVVRFVDAAPGSGCLFLGLGVVAILLAMVAFGCQAYIRGLIEVIIHVIGFWP